MRLAGGVLALLTLAGCSVVGPPLPGLTESEIAEIQQLQADVAWHHTGLAAELRPAVPRVQTVSSDEWAEVVSDCMNREGFENYRDVGNSLSVEFIERAADDAQAETIAFFRCRTSVRVLGNEQSWFNSAQVEYIYDYFQEVLMPCLVTHNVTMLHSPTRAEFIKLNGQWNPYFAIHEASLALLAADESILADCPANPPGITAWEFNADSFEVVDFQ